MMHGDDSDMEEGEVVDTGVTASSSQHSSIYMGGVRQKPSRGPHARRSMH